MWDDVGEGLVDLHASRMHVIIRNTERLNQTGPIEVPLSRVAMHPVQQITSQ